MEILNRDNAKVGRVVMFRGERREIDETSPVGVWLKPINPALEPRDFIYFHEAKRFNVVVESVKWQQEGAEGMVRYFENNPNGITPIGFKRQLNEEGGDTKYKPTCPECGADRTNSGLCPKCD